MIKSVLSEDLSNEEGWILVERLDLVKEETNFAYEELINNAAVAREESPVQQMFKPRSSRMWSWTKRTEPRGISYPWAPGR